MRYSLCANQVVLKEWGVRNINQGLVIDMLMTASTWATPTTIDGDVYYWVSRSVIADELWILNMKSDTVYRHLKSIADLGIINYKKQEKKDYIRVTEKGKSYLSGRYVGNESEKEQNSEMNPSKLGNESENNSDLNPTYHNTSNNHTYKTNHKSVATEVATNKEAENVAKHLLNSILSWKPNFKRPTDAQFARWVSDIDKAMRLDNRTPNELIGAIDWMQTPRGGFWRPNILSGKKLREKFDTMEAQSMKPSIGDTALQEGMNLSDAMKREAGVL